MWKIRFRCWLSILPIFEQHWLRALCVSGSVLGTGNAKMQPRERSSSPMGERNKETQDRAQNLSACILASLWLWPFSGTIISPLSSILTDKFIPTSHLVIVITYIKPFRSQDHPQSLFHLLAAAPHFVLFFVCVLIPFQEQHKFTSCPAHSSSKGIFVTWAYPWVSLSTHSDSKCFFQINTGPSPPKKRALERKGRGLHLCSECSGSCPVHDRRGSLCGRD